MNKNYERIKTDLEEEKKTESSTEYLFTFDDLYSNNFHYIFERLRKKYHIKKSRKIQIDSILKKTKCKFFRMIHEVMKFFFGVKLKKLPQSFITNSNIDFNQKYLKKTVIQIYQEFKIISEKDILEESIYKNKKELKELFTSFSSGNLEVLYKEYIKSKRYQNDYEEIKKMYGKQMSFLYDFVSKNYIGFFLYSIRNEK